jgi:hypothetical protein
MSNIVSSTPTFTIRDTLTLWCEPESVYELRCPNAGQRGTIAGYFTDLAKLADMAEWLSASGVPAVYLTLNAVNPALLARGCNRAKDRARETTADADILRRARLLIDCDAVRPAGISSNAAEHDAAIARARTVRDWLTGQGFPECILGDSGNGGHLLYKIDLPNDEPTAGLLAAFLSALSERFSDATVKIDTSVDNAARDKQGIRHDGAQG